MKVIELTKGQVTIVDDEDYEYLNQWKWFAAKRKHGYYAAKSGLKWGNKGANVFMHRVLMKTPQGLVCDHKDRNTLNNQKTNLRNCTQAQNNQNVSSHKNSSSIFLGVSVGKEPYYGGKRPRYWRARISVNKEIFALGLFPYTPEGEIAAAKCYDEAAKKYFGEFANLNFKN